MEIDRKDVNIQIGKRLREARTNMNKDKIEFAQTLDVIEENYRKLEEGSTGLSVDKILIPVVTKGLTRRKILAAKAVMLTGMWTVLYFLCYGITYGYNAWFWDNSITAFPLFEAVCYWFFGIWVIALMVFFSTVSGSNTQVLLGTGVISFGTYLLGMFPKLNDVLPAKLMEGMAVLQGMAKPEDYYISMAAAGVTAVLFIGLSTVCFDKRQL